MNDKVNVSDMDIHVYIYYMVVMEWCVSNGMPPSGGLEYET